MLRLQQPTGLYQHWVTWPSPPLSREGVGGMREYDVELEGTISAPWVTLVRLSSPIGGAHRPGMCRTPRRRIFRSIFQEFAKIPLDPPAPAPLPALSNCRI